MTSARNLSIFAPQVSQQGTLSYNNLVDKPQVITLKCTSIQYPGNDLAADPAGGQTITLIGTGFEATPTVYVGGVVASSVTFVSSTQITFTSPARVAGTYDIYVVNPGGATAIFVFGISYSGTPAWTTAAGSLGTVDANFSIQLQATSNSAVTYSLANGSSLPSGVALSSSGLLTGTGLSVEQTFTFSVVATDLENQDTARSFQVTVVLADPFFEYVTLLLAGDSSIVPFNSDLSTNKFNLSINGDTKPNNFSPYTTGYYSNYFDGNGDYLSIAPTAALQFDTGDFTIEAWVYFATAFNGRLISRRWPLGGAAGTWALNLSNTTVGFTESIAGEPGPSATFSSIVGRWAHIAVARQSGTARIFLDGTQIASQSFTNNLNDSTYSILIGADNGGTASFFPGYISNLRVVKGTALYTAAFTPSTVPLTAVANTSLLTCQSNRFIDASTNNLTITRNGDVSVQAFDPFILPSNLQTLGSTFFDGNGDSFNVVANTNIAFGTGDFTVEAWVYPRSFPLNTYVVDTRPNASWSLSFNYQGTNGTNSQLAWSDSTNIYQTSTATPLNQWNHVAYTRSGTTGSLYLNGVRVLTFTDTFNYTTSGTMWIGARHSNTQHWDGYMSNLRIVQGTAVYTGASYTVPTSPLTAVTNTQLLTLQTNQGANNSGILDSSLNSFPITRNGNTTQGTFTPYGQNWSNYFDGTGDYLSLTGTALGSGNFTVECWFNMPSWSTSNYPIIGSNSSGTTAGWELYLNGPGSNIRLWSNAGDVISSSTTIQKGVWYHLALVRSGSTATLYINGVNTGSATFTSNLTNTTMYVSYDQYAQTMTGYVSNVRHVVGTAVYTSAFTPPTAPLTAVSGTSLLTCQSNRFVDNSANNFAITVNGDTSVQRFSPFHPTAPYAAGTIGGSGYFDGSGDNLTLPSNAAFQFGTGDFCLEAWIYPTDATTFRCIWGQRGGSSGDNSWVLAYNPTNNGSWGYIYLHTDATAVFGSSTIVPLNSWTQVVFTCVSGRYRIFQNGVLTATTTASYNFNETTGPRLGAEVRTAIGAASPFIGYMGNARITKGGIPSAYSTSSTTVGASIFTPQTTPSSSSDALTAGSLSVLLNMTNGGIIDNAMMNDLETVGNAQISTSVSRFGGGSLAFDGSGDYLVPSSPATNLSLVLGSGDFTIEMWVYFNGGLGSDILLYDSRPLSTNGVYPTIYVNSSSQLAYVVSSSDRIVATTAFVTGQWYHIAICRSGTSTRMFINGTQTGSTYSDSNNYLNPARRPVIAINGFNETAAPLNGYIDDLRVTKYARYTANFTPPTNAHKLR